MNFMLVMNLEYFPEISEQPGLGWCCMNELIQHKIPHVEGKNSSEWNLSE